MASMSALVNKTCEPAIHEEIVSKEFESFIGALGGKNTKVITASLQVLGNMF